MCFFKQKTAYEMRISDWSSDVCSSDLLLVIAAQQRARTVHDGHMAAELVEDARKFIGDIAAAHDPDPLRALLQMEKLVGGEIGRASCRERVCKYVEISVGAGLLKNKNIKKHTTTAPIA